MRLRFGPVVMALSIIISLSVFLKVFNENTHPKKDLLIRSPYIDAIPGRQMKEKFVKDFNFDFERIPSGTNIISIIMGGGNVIWCNDCVGAFRVEEI